jgi:Cu(I)/Ag(I) efflux system membrane fusion protein/cobalt-zinc-cadmium efflux system membrane fusion protein
MVEKGHPMFMIFSPELITAQEEYLAAYRSNPGYSEGNERKMLASARRRLNYYDISEKEIHSIETSGVVMTAIKIRSPFKGVVTFKNAVKGGYVKAGATIYEIADLSRVWVEAHIYEYELSLVKTGMEVQMTLPYHPGKVYTGKVAYVYPYLQQKTRDVVVRLEFENPELELKPGMYSDVLIKTGTGDEGLIIPSESVIRSGTRNIVFVPREGGKFTPRKVNLGFSLDGGMVQVLSGLAPGESVVTSGQFLLDSESKLKEAVQKMLEAKKSNKKSSKDADDGFFKDMESDDGFFNDMEEKA